MLHQADLSSQVEKSVTEETEEQQREMQEQEKEMEQERETEQQGHTEEQERELEEQESESQGIDYFTRPEPAILQAFLDYHPQQNTSSAVVMRVFSCKDGTNRKWLTYCKGRHLLFCFVCLAFARWTDTSPQARFNMLSDAYGLLGLAYKYLLTLTQVACERTFSTLKFIKSRLRSNLSANKQEIFMLMVTEKDILMSLDSDKVIDGVAEKNDLLRKLLL
ncbi:glycine hydroxymethyltransferase [Sarotherodon galilaeus]